MPPNTTHTTLSCFLYLTSGWNNTAASIFVSFSFSLLFNSTSCFCVSHFSFHSVFFQHQYIWQTLRPQLDQKTNFPWNPLDGWSGCSQPGLTSACVDQIWLSERSVLWLLMPGNDVVAPAERPARCCRQNKAPPVCRCVGRWRWTLLPSEVSAFSSQLSLAAAYQTLPKDKDTLCFSLSLSFFYGHKDRLLMRLQPLSSDLTLGLLSRVSAHIAK